MHAACVRIPSVQVHNSNKPWARTLPNRPIECAVLHCRFSVPQQRASVAKLLQYDWLTVLPAHGRRARMRDAVHRLEVRHVCGGKEVAAGAALVMSLGGGGWGVGEVAAASVVQPRA